ncbi:MAG: polysaccharide deacetylase family protein [Armatimonadota bacterium]
MIRHTAVFVAILGLLVLCPAHNVRATELPAASLQLVAPGATAPESLAPPPLPRPAPRPISKPVVSRNPVPPRYRGYVVSKRDTVLREKVIALTFDDGPSPDITPSVLKTLARYKAKATFFVMGQWVQEYPALAQQVATAGHAVESHSFSHPTDDVNIPHATRELERAATIIEQICGSRPHLFRPPYGALHWNMSKVAARQGYCVVKWTLCGADGAKENAADIVRNVTTAPHPGDIVLLHDGHDHEETVRALPEIMRRLSAQGYRFVTLPQLLRMWDVAKGPVKSVRKPARTAPRKGTA